MPIFSRRGSFLKPSLRTSISLSLTNSQLVEENHYGGLKAIRYHVILSLTDFRELAKLSKMSKIFSKNFAVRDSELSK